MHTCIMHTIYVTLYRSINYTLCKWRFTSGEILENRFLKCYISNVAKIVEQFRKGRILTG